MVFGKPVIAGNAGGAPEVVTHDTTGLLVAPGDASALADAPSTPCWLTRRCVAGWAMPGAAITKRFTGSGMVRDFLAAFARMGLRADPEADRHRGYRGAGAERVDATFFNNVAVLPGRRPGVGGGA